MKRGHPRGGEVRKSKAVGPDYPTENYRNPVNNGIDFEYGSMSDKTVCSPSGTIELPGSIHKGAYDRYWEGK